MSLHFSPSRSGCRCSVSLRHCIHCLMARMIRRGSVMPFLLQLGSKLSVLVPCMFMVIPPNGFRDDTVRGALTTGAQLTQSSASSTDTFEVQRTSDSPNCQEDDIERLHSCSAQEFAHLSRHSRNFCCQAVWNPMQERLILARPRNQNDKKNNGNGAPLQECQPKLS